MPSFPIGGHGRSRRKRFQDMYEEGEETRFASARLISVKHLFVRSPTNGRRRWPVLQDKMTILIKGNVLLNVIIMLLSVRQV